MDLILMRPLMKILRLVNLVILIQKLEVIYYFRYLIVEVRDYLLKKEFNF